MKLRQTHAYERAVTYDISIGGVAQIRWKTGRALPSMLLWRPQHGPMIGPLVNLRNNGILAIAWPVMRYQLETARCRYAQEPVWTYLVAMWHQALEHMGVPPGFNTEKVLLTAEMLKGSKALKEMRMAPG